VCYQTRDIVEVMTRDAGAHMTSLRVDGGMTQNNLLIQLQADILGIPIGTFMTNLIEYLQ
jgi:glycerol kinase